MSLLPTLFAGLSADTRAPDATGPEPQAAPSKLPDFLTAWQATLTAAPTRSGEIIPPGGNELPLDSDEHELNDIQAATGHALERDEPPLSLSTNTEPDSIIVRDRPDSVDNRKNASALPQPEIVTDDSARAPLTFSPDRVPLSPSQPVITNTVAGQDTAQDSDGPANKSSVVAPQSLPDKLVTSTALTESPNTSANARLLPLDIAVPGASVADANIRIPQYKVPVISPDSSADKDSRAASPAQPNPQPQKSATHNFASQLVPAKHTPARYTETSPTQPASSKNPTVQNSNNSLSAFRFTSDITRVEPSTTRPAITGLDIRESAGAVPLVSLRENPSITLANRAATDLTVSLSTAESPKPIQSRQVLAPGSQQTVTADLATRAAIGVESEQTAVTGLDHGRYHPQLIAKPLLLTPQQVSTANAANPDEIAPGRPEQLANSKAPLVTATTTNTAAADARPAHAVISANALRMHSESVAKKQTVDSEPSPHVATNIEKTAETTLPGTRTPKVAVAAQAQAQLPAQPPVNTNTVYANTELKITGQGITADTGSANSVGDDLDIESPQLKTTIQNEGSLRETPSTPRVLSDSAARLSTTLARAPISTESPEFAERIGERVLVATDGQLGKASIKLTPQALGELSIDIDYSDEGTKVQFTSSTAAAREILESHLPRLRDVLEQAGVKLGETAVGQQNQGSRADSQSQHQSRSAAGNRSNSEQNALTDTASAASDSSTEPQQRQQSVIDTYV